MGEGRVVVGGLPDRNGQESGLLPGVGSLEVEPEGGIWAQEICGAVAEEEKTRPLGKQLQRLFCAQGCLRVPMHLPASHPLKLALTEFLLRVQVGLYQGFEFGAL